MARASAWRRLASRPPANLPLMPFSSSSSSSSSAPSPLRLQQPQRRSCAAAAAASPLPKSQRRLFSSELPHRTGSGNSSSHSSSRIKFWPFVAIIALGSAGYVSLVNCRKGAMAAPTHGTADALPLPPQQQQLTAPPKSTPAFSPDDVTVLFVLGGPGAGKGTQCARLVADHGFVHLSAGDLLRTEQDLPGSQFGDLIRDHIKNGLIVPMEVTVQLLENAMAEALRTNNGSKGRFLIDGFPRKMDQALRFEQAVCPARLVLFFDCPENVMERRLLERGKTSGRADDNADSIRKRFRTFIDTSMPVVDYFESQAKVLRIDATPDPDAVYAATRKRLADALGSSI